MNAYAASRLSSSPDRRPHGRAPWVALAAVIVGFVAFMESFEALGMAGHVSLDVVNAIAIPLMPVLAAIPLVLGVRAVRHRATGYPWIPTILSGILVVLFAVNVVMALLIG